MSLLQQTFWQRKMQCAVSREPCKPDMCETTWQMSAATTTMGTRSDLLARDTQIEHYVPTILCPWDTRIRSWGHTVLINYGNDEYSSTVLDFLVQWLHNYRLWIMMCVKRRVHVLTSCLGCAFHILLRKSHLHMREAAGTSRRLL